MTKADVEYLEYKGVKIANEENRYVLENTQIPKMPNLPEHQRDAMNEFFEDCVFLTSFIGCSLFVSIAAKQYRRILLLRYCLLVIERN